MFSRISTVLCEVLMEFLACSNLQKCAVLFKLCRKAFQCNCSQCNLTQSPRFCSVLRKRIEFILLKFRLLLKSNITAYPLLFPCLFDSYCARNIKESNCRTERDTVMKFTVIGFEAVSASFFYYIKDSRQRNISIITVIKIYDSHEKLAMILQCQVFVWIAVTINWNGNAWRYWAL